MTGLTSTRPRPRSTSSATGRPPRASTDDGAADAAATDAGAGFGEGFGRTGVIAGLIRRTVGVRPAFAVSARRLAFTPAAPSRARRRRRPGPSRQARTGPLAPSTTQPRHVPAAQPIRGSTMTWSHAFRRASGDPAAGGRPPPRFRPSVATPRRPRRPSGQPGERAEQRGRPGGERLVGPSLVVLARHRAPTRDGRASRRRSPPRTRPRPAAGSSGRPGPTRRRRTAASPTVRPAPPRPRAGARPPRTRPSAISSR